MDYLHENKKYKKNTKSVIRPSVSRNPVSGPKKFVNLTYVCVSSTGFRLKWFKSTEQNIDKMYVCVRERELIKNTLKLPKGPKTNCSWICTFWISVKYRRRKYLKIFRRTHFLKKEKLIWRKQLFYLFTFFACIKCRFFALL